MQLTLSDGSTINIDVHKKHIKNMMLRVYPDGNVKVSAPAKMPDKTIRLFVQSKQMWIEKHVLHKEKIVRPENTIRLLGQDYERLVVRGEKNSVEVQNERIVIYCKEQYDEEVVLANWWRKTSEEYFNLYVKKWMQLLETTGIQTPRVRVRKMKTMWGSCTYKKAEIRYNYYLFCAPPVCVEYVVLHELAHLLYPNHGERFKSFMTTHMPNWKEYRKQLQMESDILRGNQ